MKKRILHPELEELKGYIGKKIAFKTPLLQDGRSGTFVFIGEELKVVPDKSKQKMVPILKDRFDNWVNLEYAKTNLIHE